MRIGTPQASEGAGRHLCPRRAVTRHRLGRTSRPLGACRRPAGAGPPGLHGPGPPVHLGRRRPAGRTGRRGSFGLRGEAAGRDPGVHGRPGRRPSGRGPRGCPELHAQAGATPAAPDEAASADRGRARVRPRRTLWTSRRPVHRGRTRPRCPRRPHGPPRAALSLGWSRDGGRAGGGGGHPSGRRGTGRRRPGRRPGCSRAGGAGGGAR